MARWSAVLLAVCLAHGARAAEPAADDAPDSGEKRRRRGFLDDEAMIKWSGQTLREDEWVVGLTLVAHGLTDELTLGTLAGDLLLGHYNARLRARVGHRPGRRVTSVDGGAGLVTPLGLALLAVPGVEPPATLATADVGLPITWTVATGRFVTVRPWLALSVGGVDDDARSTLPLILRRPAFTGPGVTLTGEGHFARRVGAVASLDLGLELYGGEPAFGSTTRVAVLLATGPLRAQLGFGLVLGVDRFGEVQLGAVPAADIWVRF